MLPLFLLTFVALVAGYVVRDGNDCHLYPEASLPGAGPMDDVPSIYEAFNQCGHNGRVIFEEGTFHVNQVLNTTGLHDCDVILKGELLFSDDIPYWLANSLWVVYQNQHTAWLFGGENVRFIGQGGSFNGNGQAWYTQNQNRANQPGRPIAITFHNSKNLVVDGLSFIQPQFWVTLIWESEDVTMKNIYVSAHSDDHNGCVNTDGGNTWNSRRVTFENWFVRNGDDCIAVKGNSSDIYVRNVTCVSGNGMTIGSVGEYPKYPDYVENVLFEDITIRDTMQAAYIKTWQGQPADHSGNGAGGGGGAGIVRNVTFRNFDVDNSALPIQISQCIYTEDGENCDSSRMQISEITWENFKGTSRYNIASSIHCAAGHPCPDIYFKNVDIKSINETRGLPLTHTDLPYEVHQCANIVNQNTTSGIKCNLWAPNNFSQLVHRNVASHGYRETDSPRRRAKFALRVSRKVVEVVQEVKHILIAPFIRT
jgi:galacturan 1,4-alpha-galacturonidase